MTQLDGELNELFVKARAEEDPTEDDRRAVRTALAMHLAAATAVTSLSIASKSAAAASTAGTVSGLAGGASSVAGAGATSAGVLGGAGAVTSALAGSASLAAKSSILSSVAVCLVAGAAAGTSVSIAAVNYRAAAPAEPITAPPPTVARAAPEPPVTRAVDVARTPRMAAEERVPEPVPSSPTRRVSPRPNNNDLSAEAHALSSVQIALRDQRPGEALALLEQQDRVFAGGSLAIERAAARVLALCAAGQKQAARAAAARFLAAHSASPLSERVRATCAK